jgi:hypothetical protein
LREAAFDFFLRQRFTGAGLLQSATDFIEDVEVVLNVLERAVVGELVKEGFDLLLAGHVLRLA